VNQNNQNNQNNLTYREAGVDVEKGEELARWIKKKTESLFSPNVLSGIGSFAGLYSLGEEYEFPVLAATADGVGTKLLIAQQANRHFSVGIDLVAMCINDLLTQGARPLFFLDYIATGRLSLKVGKEIISGIIEGCRQAECILLGGETAEMPSFYPEGRYDLAGFALGVVERKRIVDGSSIRPGDLLLGLTSSGLHSNGFSLVRKIIFEERSFPLNETIAELDSTLLSNVLQPTRIYTGQILPLLEGFSIKGIAHITGGGIPGNLPRILPARCRARIQVKSWSPPAIFHFLQKEGNLTEEEMFRTFNMGIGMILVVDPSEVEAILSLPSSKGQIKVIGKILSGQRGLELTTD